MDSDLTPQGHRLPSSRDLSRFDILVNAAKWIDHDETFRWLLQAASCNQGLSLKLNEVYWESFTVTRDHVLGYDNGIFPDDSEAIDWTFRNLFQHKSRVTRIRQFGGLFSQNYEQIFDWVTSDLQAVQIRALNHHGPNKKKIGQYGYFVQPLDFSRLANFQLREVDISYLQTSEASSLARALSSWPNLRKLRVEASKGDMEAIDSPLAILLRLIWRDSHLYFPSLLDNLTLIDNAYRGFPLDEEEQRQIGEQLEFGSASSYLLQLSRAHLEISDACKIATILECLHAYNLENLTLSTLPKNVFRRHTKLEAVVVQNAWGSSHVMDVFPRGTTAGVLQVRLTGPELHYDGFGCVVPNEHDNYLNERIVGRFPQIAPWGNVVQHLRIDNVELDTLRLERITNPTFGLNNLKILVIRGRPRQAMSKAMWTLKFPYERQNLLGWAPDGRFKYRLARHVAEYIKRQSLPRLAFVAIRRHHFWIDRTQIRNSVGNLPGDEERPSALWDFSDAVRDPAQSMVISRSMQPRDWNFIADEILIMREDTDLDTRRRHDKVTIYRDSRDWAMDDVLLKSHMAKIEPMLKEMVMADEQRGKKRGIGEEHDGGSTQNGTMTLTFRPAKKGKWINN